MPKILQASVIACIFTLYAPSVFAGDIASCTNKEGYDLFVCRSEQICEEYKPQNDIIKELVYPRYDKQDIKESELILNVDKNKYEKIKKEYSQHMDSIYACAILNKQNLSFNYIKGILAQERHSQTYQIESKLESGIQKTTTKMAALGCNSYSTKTGPLIRKEILKEVTYNTCKYVSYLDYLQWYYQDLQNLYIDMIEKNEDGTVPIMQVVNTSQNFINSIASEKQKSFEVASLTYQNYTQYAEYYTLHVLLELIQVDIRFYTKAIYQNLMPIAQVGYKVINKMMR